MTNRHDVGQEYVDRAASVVADLRSRYPEVELEHAVQAVDTALEALLLTGLLEDPDGERIMRILSERDIRLRLGREVEQAHLDPQIHPRRHVTP
jgi:hypothetical protein